MIIPENEHNTLLLVDNLSIAFGKESREVVQHVSFSVEKGSCVGLVGESGSGKSLTSLAIMGLLPKGARLSSGKISLTENNITTSVSELSEKELRQIRGLKIAMIFQEPMTSLNPFLRCGEQVEEAMLLHHIGNKQYRKERVLELFREVLLPTPEEMYRRFPHQLSGGQRQRVMIALALSCNPSLLIADEPTTALDVSVQKEIIDLLHNIQQKRGLSILFISHDLALIQSIAQKVIVLYKGSIVESGSATDIFLSPTHPYTKGLVACRPSGKTRITPLTTVSDFLEDTIPQTHTELKTEREARHQQLYAQQPILEVNNLSVRYRQNSAFALGSAKLFNAVDEVSFNLYPGETLGLVGESGCGKSTLGKAIMRLTDHVSGSVKFKGQELTTMSSGSLLNIRKHIQFIFQDPFSSLNPRLTVGECVVEPMFVHRIGSSSTERWNIARELFNKVGLSENFLGRYPHELSGGQRQRVAIARALATKPEIIICDESVSALDVSVQAMVLNVLNNLKAEFGLTYIFISHDLGVIRYMSDRIAVMQKGQLVEYNEADLLFANPSQAYTKHLLSCMPEYYSK
jgi:peptide/nickel transport system ATP-binding protein